MQEQLLLVRSEDQSWRLDEHTREVGRQGVRDARAALRQAAAAAGGGSPDGGRRQSAHTAARTADRTAA